MLFKRDVGLLVRPDADVIQKVFDGVESLVVYLGRHCSGEAVLSPDSLDPQKTAVRIPWGLLQRWLDRWIPDDRYIGWQISGTPQAAE